ncbi:MAG: DMT family transporter [Pirellulaceae bacterium]|nr:DMT family transporter [Pirellulaceae bacterium]
MNGRTLAILTVVVMVVQTLLMRAALTHWPVGMVGTFSRVFTIGVLGIWVLGRREGWRRLKPRGAGGWLLLMAINAIALNLLLFTSLKYTTVTNHALLYRLDVVFVVLIGTLLGLERIGWRELALLPLMLFGVACMAEIRLSGLEAHVTGDLMVVGGALGFAVNAFILRHIFRTMDTEAVALINVSATALGFLGTMLARNELAHVGVRIADPAIWLWVVLFGMTFAVYLAIYYATLNLMPVWKLRMWMLAAPVLIAGADWIFWNTRLSMQQGIGMGFVLAGLAGLIHLERNGR